ncbi:MAG: DUF1304 domain-containing protein [Myxococcales bacterium]|nr:DUF1304 domain-containing protein [Myxococcales bacterium]
MKTAARIVTGLIGLLHIYILVLEMFLWTSERGQKAFAITAEYAEMTKVLAANQGLYNGFLAAGLVWSVLHPDARIARQLRFFFLGCVAVAGVYGAATANMKILYIQTVPAVLGLLLVALAGGSTEKSKNQG